MICPAWDCDNKATRALVYGCLNLHVNTIIACVYHGQQYENAIASCHCGECGERYADVIIRDVSPYANIGEQ